MPSERLQDHETPQLPHRMVGNPWTLIFFWDLAIQNANVDEMRCVCVDEIHSDGLTSDLQESLDHLLYHPNIFWLNMIMQKIRVSDAVDSVHQFCYSCLC